MHHTLFPEVLCKSTSGTTFENRDYPQPSCCASNDEKCFLHILAVTRLQSLVAQSNVQCWVSPVDAFPHFSLGCISYVQERASRFYLRSFAKVYLNFHPAVFHNSPRFHRQFHLHPCSPLPGAMLHEVFGQTEFTNKCCAILTSVLIVRR